MAENHPDFLGAPEQVRWTGTLPQLAEVLKHEAYELKGEWAQRILPGGALVCMRVQPETFKKELRIARRLRKEFTQKSATAWATERETFLKELGCKEWGCVHGSLFTPGQIADKTLSKIECLYIEDAALGGRRAKLRCVKCGELFEPKPHDRVYREAVCDPCAIKAGDLFTAEKREERKESK